MAKKKTSAATEKKLTADMTLRNVPTPVKEAIENIARNQGESVTGFMKSHLRKIVQEYPENMRARQD